MRRTTRTKADFAAKRAQRALAALNDAYDTLAEITAPSLAGDRRVPACDPELAKIADAIGAVREAGARYATEAGWTPEDLREAGFAGEGA